MSTVDIPKQEQLFYFECLPVTFDGGFLVGDGFALGSFEDDCALESFVGGFHFGDGDLALVVVGVFQFIVDREPFVKDDSEIDQMLLSDGGKRRLMRGDCRVQRRRPG